MAMVSSCMASGAPLRDGAQQVAVHTQGRGPPRPGGAGADLVEGEGGHQGRVPLAAHHPLVQPAERRTSRAYSRTRLEGSYSGWLWTSTTSDRPTVFVTTLHPTSADCRATA